MMLSLTPGELEVMQVLWDSHSLILSISRWFGFPPQAFQFINDSVF